MPKLRNCYTTGSNGSLFIDGRPPISAKNLVPPDDLYASPRRTKIHDDFAKRTGRTKLHILGYSILYTL